MATQDHDPMQAEILREVAAEIKEEQYKQVWKKYGPLFVTLIILILAAAGGYEFYKYRSEQIALTEASELEEALTMAQEGKISAAADILVRLRDKSSSGYRYLAGLHYTDLMLQEKREVEALSSLDTIINDKKAPKPMRDMALFNKISIAVDLPDADFAALEKELAPLAGSDTAWTASALELSTLIAIRQKDYDKAKASLQRIIGLQNISDTARQRATENLALLNKQFPAK